MNRELFIHIGMSRTGTTWLQHDLFPKLKNINYISRYVKPKIFNNPFLFDIPNSGKILISNEIFCMFSNVSSYHNKNITNPEVIIKRLSKVFPDAKIIFCIRDKKDWLRSVYNNYLIAGYAFNFDFFKKDINYGVNIKNLTKLIKKLFNDIFIYDFEDFKKNNLSVLKDMCCFMGVDMPLDLNFSKRNVSIDNNMINTVLFINRISRTRFNNYTGVLPDKIRKYLIKKIQKEGK